MFLAKPVVQLDLPPFFVYAYLYILIYVCMFITILYTIIYAYNYIYMYVIMYISFLLMLLITKITELLRAFRQKAVALVQTSSRIYFVFTNFFCYTETCTQQRRRQTIAYIQDDYMIVCVICSPVCMCVCISQKHERTQHMNEDRNSRVYVLGMQKYQVSKSCINISIFIHIRHTINRSDFH